jgi:hypothetical protein
MSAPTERLSRLRREFDSEGRIIGTQEYSSDLSIAMSGSIPDLRLNGGLERYELPHPDALYEAIFPLLKFVREYESPLIMRGSGLRHTAIGMSRPIDAPRNRYSVNHFLVRSVAPYLNDQLDELRKSDSDEAREIIATQMELRGGPDFDFVVGWPSINASDRIFSALTEFMPYISNPANLHGFTTAGYETRKEQEVSRLAKAARQSWAKLDISPSPDAHQEDTTHLGPSWKYLARIDTVPVYLMPFVNNDLPPGLLRAKPRPLIVYQREFNKPGGVQVAKIGFAADLREDPNQPLREHEMSPLISLDFAKWLPEETAAVHNTRQGTSYDVAPATIDVRNQSLRVDFVGEVYDTFMEPVELLPRWEERPPGDALEVATRAIWQAIDTEINDSGRDNYITDKTLTRMADHFATIDPQEWSNISPLGKKLIQKNLLIMMITSPHRSVEYLGKSRIWDILRNSKNIHGWKEISNTVNELRPHEEYRDMLLNPNPSDWPHNMGWSYIDFACDLPNVYPDLPRDLTSLQRIHRFTTL